MGKISGDLTVMSLTDLMQWVDMNKKSGVLTISYDDTSRAIFLQDGNIIFASSHKDGERLGDFLVSSGLIKQEQLTVALHESRKLQIPFTGFMITDKMVKREALEKIITKFAEVIITDALKWNEGNFEFTDKIPMSVLNGPVRINTSLILFNTVKVMDEAGKDEKPDENLIMQEVAHRIKEGDIEIPPLPDILMRVNEAIAKDAPIPQIAKIIMSDQILTTKILKVVNSSYYSPPQKINSLKQAAVYIGFKSILSIVTAHAISGLSAAGSSEQVKEILRHSLVCAFISKMIARNLQLDQDELFVCGLLHDIGKTLLLNLLGEYKLSDEEKGNLVGRYHEAAGHTLATKWKLAETVGLVARYHHSPDKAPSSKEIVGAVSIANIITNSSKESPPEFPVVSVVDMNKIKIDGILKELEGIQSAAETMI